MFETEYFDRVAQEYDDLYLDHISQAENQIVAELINANCEHCNSVLDLGCGTGLMFDLARENAPDLGRYVGLDISAGMLEVFRNKILTSELNTVDLASLVLKPLKPELYQGDINDFEQFLEPNAKFDVCLSTFGSFSYVHDLPAAIKKISQRLTTSGFALLMFYSKQALSETNSYTEHSIDRVVSSYSFRNDSADSGSPAYFYSQTNLEKALKHAGVKKYEILGLNHHQNQEYQGFSASRIWSTLSSDMYNKQPDTAHSLILSFGFNPLFHVE